MKLVRWGLLLAALLVLPFEAQAQARPPAQKTGPITIIGSGSTGDVSKMTVTRDGVTLPLDQATLGIADPVNSTTSNLAAWGGVDGKTLFDLGFGVGTAGHSVAALDGANTWSGTQSYTGAVSYGALATFGINPVITGSIAAGVVYRSVGAHDITLGGNTASGGFGMYDAVTGWRWFVKESGGAMGVNTATPGAQLDVLGDIRGRFKSIAGTAPTGSELPDGYWTVTKSSADFGLRLCANDTGTIRCVSLQ